jgi:hypothetical protein
MRLDSQSVLKKTVEMLGLEGVDSEILQQRLSFRKGRALPIGGWSGMTPRLTSCAARRTVEGGRNLRAAHWANRAQHSTHTPMAAMSRAAASETLSGKCTDIVRLIEPAKQAVRGLHNLCSDSRGCYHH